jgi:hypothetical protein
MCVLQTTAHNCKARLNLLLPLPGGGGGSYAPLQARGRFAPPVGTPIGPARVGASSPFFFLLFRNLNFENCSWSKFDKKLNLNKILF